MPAEPRRFVQLFGGPRETSDLVGIARAACAEGYAVIAVKPRSKEPICTLTPRQRASADRLAANTARVAGHRHWEKITHPCGREHAITDPKVAERVFKRLLEQHPELNIGLEVGASRLLVVDADTREEVESFCAEWAAREDIPELANAAPTVRSPGVVKDGDNWTHKDGGHFWFTLPDDVDFTEAGSSKAMKIGAHEAKASLMFRDQLVLVPPSVRDEGPYVMASDIHPAPAWLVEELLKYVAGLALRATQARERARQGNDPIEAWSAEQPWDQILPRYGWVTAGRVANCGCEIWSRPGEWSNPRSAIAHEPGCLKWEITGGFLHIFTTEGPPELASRDNWSKLNLIAAYDYDGDVAAAMRALGIASDAEPSMTDDEIISAARASNADRLAAAKKDPSKDPADTPTEAEDAEGDEEQDPEEEEPSEVQRWLREQLDSEPSIRKRVVLELENTLAKETAKRIHRGLTAFGSRQHRLEVIARPVSAAELYARPHTPPEWVVKGLLEKGHHGLLAAPAKGGKTTMLGNLLLSLTEATAFLGQFPVPAPVGPIEVIDVEMSQRQHGRWLQDIGLRSEAVLIHHIRGEPGLFELLDETARSDWAGVLRDRGTKFLIVDPLAPLLAAAGLDENNPTDVGAWFAALKQLCSDADVDNALVVHHHGHGAERARGSSNLLATPDVLWTVVLDEDRTRYFKAVGRDVDVEESELEFDDNTRRLTIPQIGKARPERSGRQKSDPAMDRDKQDDVLNAIRGNPGITLNKLREIAGIRREDIPKVVAALRQLGLVSIKEGKNRAQHMFVSDRGWEGADDDCE